MKHHLSLKAVRFDELAGLSALDRKELVEKWRSLYRTGPPGGKPK